MMRAGLVIVAAGSGERLGREEPKALVTLGGRSLLDHVLERVRRCGVFESIVVVAPATALGACRDLVGPAGIVVSGGARRQDSVRLGLEGLSDEVEIVAVHDAARPLVPVDLFVRVLDRARETGAALAAVAVTDTVKRVDAHARVVAQLPREELWRAQTPQAFRADWLRDAHRRAAATDVEFTDDAALVAHFGHSATVVPGTETNLKITTPDDLRLAEALLRAGF